LTAEHRGWDHARGWARIWGSRLLLLIVVAWLWPTWLGGRSSVLQVQGHSMEPVRHNGDLVLARSQAAYHVGDVIVFRMRIAGADATLRVMHRIVATNADGTFTTQGDNRPLPDGYQPSPGDVLGRSRLAIPYGGLALWLLSRWWTLGAVGGILITLLLLDGPTGTDPVLDLRTPGRAPVRRVVDLRDRHRPARPTAPTAGEPAHGACAAGLKHRAGLDNTACPATDGRVMVAGVRLGSHPARGPPPRGPPHPSTSLYPNLMTVAAPGATLDARALTTPILPNEQR